jgi:nucleoside phosphorylase
MSSRGGTTQNWTIEGVQAGTFQAGGKNVVKADRPRDHRPAAGPAPTIGIVTALPEELAAMRALVDGLDDAVDVPKDRAPYEAGVLPAKNSSRPHRVVLTMLGETGNDAAAAACAHLIRSFPTVRCVIMTGIAAGVPNVADPERHVRLGDVVAATWGIVDYDHVVDTVDGTKPRQPFPRPSPILAQRAKILEADEYEGQRPWEGWLDKVVARLPTCARPPAETDVVHVDGGTGHIRTHPAIELSGHRVGHPKIHYGRIGSADRSMRNTMSRDELAARFDLRAFEMEGKGIGNAGFAGGLEWFVVRGISDYGDSGHGKTWRRYASAAAAAYVRALLAATPASVFGDSR